MSKKMIILTIIIILSLSTASLLHFQHQIKRTSPHPYTYDDVIKQLKEQEIDLIISSIRPHATKSNGIMDGEIYDSLDKEVNFLSIAIFKNEISREKAQKNEKREQERFDNNKKGLSHGLELTEYSWGNILISAKLTDAYDEKLRKIEEGHN